MIQFYMIIDIKHINAADVLTDLGNAFQEFNNSPVNHFVNKISHKNNTKNLSTLSNIFKDNNNKILTFQYLISSLLYLFKWFTDMSSTENVIFILSIINKLTTIENNSSMSFFFFIAMSLLYFIVCIVVKYVDVYLIGKNTLTDIHLPIKTINSNIPKSTKELSKRIKNLLSNLKFSSNKEIDIYNKMFEYVTNYMKGKYSGALFMGSYGSGKTEIAKEMCRLCGGGYIISVGSLALQGLAGVNIFIKCIDDAIKNNKMIIFDDGEMLLKARSTMKFKNKMKNKIFDIRINQTTKEDIEETHKKIIYLINNIFLSMSGSGNFSFVITSNTTYNVQIDEAITRRLLIYLSFDITLTENNRRDIIKLYIKKFNIKILDIHMDLIINHLVYVLENYSAREICNLLKCYEKKELNMSLIDMMIQHSTKYSFNENENSKNKNIEKDIYQEYIVENNI